MGCPHKLHRPPLFKSIFLRNHPPLISFNPARAITFAWDMRSHLGIGAAVAFMCFSVIDVLNYLPADGFTS